MIYVSSHYTYIGTYTHTYLYIHILHVHPPVFIYLFIYYRRAYWNCRRSLYKF